MSTEDAKALIHFVLSMLPPDEKRALKRELAGEFFGSGNAERDAERERARQLPVVEPTARRHPKDDR